MLRELFQGKEYFPGCSQLYWVTERGLKDVDHVSLSLLIFR